MAHLHLDYSRTITTLRSMMIDSKTGIVCTFSEGSYPTTESMQTRDMDLQGNIYYIFSSESISFKNLQQNNRIVVIFTGSVESHFLRVVGIAEIIKDADRINKFWLNSDQRRFKEGKTDPKIRILKITIASSHCLKFPSNNMIDILKLLGRAIAGREGLGN